MVEDLLVGLKIDPLQACDRIQKPLSFVSQTKGILVPVLYFEQYIWWKSASIIYLLPSILSDYVTRKEKTFKAGVIV